MNTKLLRDALNSGADEAVKTPLEDAIQKVENLAPGLQLVTCNQLKKHNYKL